MGDAFFWQTLCQAGVVICEEKVNEHKSRFEKWLCLSSRLE
jgi:hypothetical protein